MPVVIVICWEVEDWVAWVVVVPFVEGEEVEGRSPPSRFRASWILVSLVSRLRTALRMRGSGAIVVGLVGWAMREGVVKSMLEKDRCELVMSGQSMPGSRLWSDGAEL